MGFGCGWTFDIFTRPKKRSTESYRYAVGGLLQCYEVQSVVIDAGDIAAGSVNCRIEVNFGLKDG